MKAAPLLAALLAFPAPAAAQQPALTLAELRAMDPVVRAGTLLGKAGGMTAEHRIIAGEGGFRGVDGLHAVEFAGAPEGEHGGLCRSEILRLAFAPLDRTPRKDPPVRVSHFDTGRRWAAVPGIEGKPSAADCRALGTVLEPPRRPGPYFTATGPGGRELFAVTIRRALGLLRRYTASHGAGIGITCFLGEDAPGDPRAAGCGDPAVAIGLLDPSRMAAIALGSCRDNRQCVTFRFGDPTESEFEESWLELQLQTDASGGEDLGEDARATRARLSKGIRTV